MIAGGSGLIGRHLAGALLRRVDEVLLLSRDPARAQPLLPGAAVLAWRLGSDGLWQDELEVVDALIDLSGGPVLHEAGR
jgi:NAD dependent epimerase/dehydratase family enzyme